MSDDRPLVLFVTAELAPWSQVGGLGEVAASLPGALRDEGFDVVVLTPLHRRVRETIGELEEACDAGQIDFAYAPRPFRLLRRRGERPEDVPVRFLEAADFFETEDDLYGRDAGIMGVGHLRWLFFAAAVRPACRALGLGPDLVHVHDWHGALAPALDRCDHHFDEDARETAWVLTVHNAAYQGVLGRDEYEASGLRRDLLAEPFLLQDGDVHLLKAGVVFADRVTTVSPTYADELCRPEGGRGLHDRFEARREHLVGILNGLDLELWNPETDPEIPARFSSRDLAGKERCRAALAEELGIEVSPRAPLCGVVARLTEQKGLDLLLDAAEEILAVPGLSLAVLGTGDAEIEGRLRDLEARHPKRVAVRIAFDTSLAHRIEAGADLFLMPSRFEPCGLNQMISQRYGTLPLVRRTGGLADTVRGHGEHERPDGFVFDAAEPEALIEALKAALEVFADPPAWRAMIRTAMALDRSWRRSAERYAEVYLEAIEARRSGERDDILDPLQLEPREPFLAPQRRIPESYPVDALKLSTVDPRRLYAWWEVSGPRGREILEALDDLARYTARWELRMIELGTGSRWNVEVEGWAKNWFLQVEPRGRYRAELWMIPPDGEARRLARSETVSTPPDREWAS